MITFFPSRCYNGGKQHRFEARVTEDYVPEKGKFEMIGDVSDDVMLALLARGAKIRHYHGDVCIWCGQVTKATKDSP